jgi:hypothetical protein
LHLSAEELDLGRVYRAQPALDLGRNRRVEQRLGCLEFGCDSRQFKLGVLKGTQRLAEGPAIDVVDCDVKCRGRLCDCSDGDREPPPAMQACRPGGR